MPAGYARGCAIERHLRSQRPVRHPQVHNNATIGVGIPDLKDVGKGVGCVLERQREGGKGSRRARGGEGNKGGRREQERDPVWMVGGGCPPRVHLDRSCWPRLGGC